MNIPLIKKRFTRSLQTYNKTASVQLEMARALINLIPQDKQYDAVLEIGCGTGFLTRELNNNIKYHTLTTNDIVDDCQKYIQKINNKISFIKGDIHSLELNTKYDLIASNAVFQWFNIQDTLSKLKKQLTPNGIIAFSTFGEKNFYELREVFNVGLEYSKLTNPNYEYTTELQFDTLLDLLKHIQNTGVNAITDYQLTKGKLQELEEKYIQKYGKIKLTYNPTFFIF